MTLDFRASQFRGAKFIASGSTGTGARILFYDIAADSTTTPNIGSINPAKFVTSSIGVDVFLYVSGTVSSGSSTDAISVFGGSLKVSGVLSVGSSSVRIDSNSVMFSTASGGAGGAFVKVQDAFDGTSHVADQNSLTIQSGKAFNSGSGGSLYLTAGDAGWTAQNNIGRTGGSIVLQTGNAAYVASPSTTAGVGGSLTVAMGSGSISNTSTKAGAGGGFTLTTGKGGDGNSSGTGGTGGSISITGGDGGTPLSTGLPGDGADVSIFAGSGPAVSSSGGGTSGFGGSITILPGAGTNNDGPGTGSIGGNLTLQAGRGGYGGINGGNQAAGGLLKLEGSTRYYSDINVSGSNLQATGFNRFFYNAEVDSGTAGFPGRDITFYVSGTIGVTADWEARKAVFGGDVYVSGGLYVNGVAVNTGSSGATTASVHVFTGSIYTVTNDDNNKIILCTTATLVRVTGSALPGVTVEFVQSSSYQITFGTAANHWEISYPSTFNSGTNEKWSNAIVTVLTASTPTTSNFVLLRGDLELAASSSFITTFMPIGSYLSTTSTASNPHVAGQAVLSQSEANNYDIRLRGVLSTTNGSMSASLQLWNINSGAYVEIGGPGVTKLTSVSTTPTQVQSVNLLSAVNFGTGSNIYEVQVFTTTGSQQAIHGSSMFVIF